MLVITDHFKKLMINKYKLIFIIGSDSIRYRYYPLTNEFNDN